MVEKSSQSVLSELDRWRKTANQLRVDVISCLFVFSHGNYSKIHTSIFTHLQVNFELLVIIDDVLSLLAL